MLGKENLLFLRIVGSALWLETGEDEEDERWNGRDEHLPREKRALRGAMHASFFNPLPPSFHSLTFLRFSDSF